ncbi:MAG: isoprenylcysteine carboxylmethyltransferase family protein [Ktedonobacterales bacterium]
MRFHSPSSSVQRAPAAPDMEDRNGPGVRIPPPVFFVAALLIGLLLQVRFPVSLFLARPIALGLGAALAIAGGLFIVTAIPAMVRGHGTLNTAAPSAALVVSGPYRISRNPMYVGLVLLYSGLACGFAVVWALPLLIPLIVYTQIGVIAPEERYLTHAFGDTYRTYMAHVRRWL